MKQVTLTKIIDSIVGECGTDRLTGTLTIKIEFTQGGIGHAMALREYKTIEDKTFITIKTPINRKK